MEYPTSNVTTHNAARTRSQGAYVGDAFTAIAKTIREMNLVGSDHWKAEQHLLKLALPDSNLIGGSAPANRPLFAVADPRPEVDSLLVAPRVLLARYGNPISVHEFYAGLVLLGFVERVVRHSNSEGTAGYWRLTPAGTWVGRNRIHEDSFVDTQVHIFESRFVSLLRLMGVKARKVTVH